MKRSLFYLAILAFSVMSCGTAGHITASRRYEDGIYYKAEKPAWKPLSQEEIASRASMGLQSKQYDTVTVVVSPYSYDWYRPYYFYGGLYGRYSYAWYSGLYWDPFWDPFWDPYWYGPYYHYSPYYYHRYHYHYRPYYGRNDRYQYAAHPGRTRSSSGIVSRAYTPSPATRGRSSASKSTDMGYTRSRSGYTTNGNSYRQAPSSRSSSMSRSSSSMSRSSSSMSRSSSGSMSRSSSGGSMSRSSGGRR